MPPLGDLSPEQFLRDYWQKRPLVVRGALPDFGSPLTPEELAGLALDEDVTARLVLERGGRHPWEVRHGPFAEQDFTTLPETHWTLLVQEVDRMVPAVARLLDAFAFLPNWRLDDVMVSYAPDRGTVGPHVDSYDVFLVQGLGRRRWQIGDGPVREERYRKGLDLRLLERFEPAREWVLEPGDLLYLPPRWAHHGVALGDCMTFSVGCRAPALGEMIAAFVHHAAADLPERLYHDPDLAPAPHPGEIAPEARQRLRAWLRDGVRALLVDDEALDHRIGALLTVPPRGPVHGPPGEAWNATEVRAALEAGAVVHRHAASLLAFARRDDGGATLFAAGRAYALSPALVDAAPLVTGPGPLTADILDDDDALPALLAELVEQGVLWIEER